MDEYEAAAIKRLIDGVRRREDPEDPRGCLALAIILLAVPGIVAILEWFR